MLNTIVYVFCGHAGYGPYLNSIEVIKKTSLFSQSTACWQLIEVSNKILAPRVCPAVTPITETEIAILGGSDYGFLSDIVVFDTTT